ncbi:hypothetical protein EAX61_13075 [Dokdonia sinensis]|uniref:Uncharacterized protein n=1 Tax=Dokdonia sinensis TaxID=2479847 RepID=A0A3M0G497_9FLAO|nr:hypothetical protein [Dokdonia sinensis]RMB56733.1 hypothetical protein EAX61_13075 [Dokdonia sinensis]
MKTTHIMIAGMIFISAFLPAGQAGAKAQTPTTNEKIQKQIDSTGNFNMLDAQAGIFGNLFGASDLNFAGVTDYRSLLARLEIDPEQREEMLTQYHIHRLSQDPAKQDSLKIMVTKMLEKAKQKNLDDPNRN